MLARKVLIVILLAFVVGFQMRIEKQIGEIRSRVVKLDPTPWPEPSPPPCMSEEKLQLMDKIKVEEASIARYRAFAANSGSDPGFWLEYQRKSEGELARLMREFNRLK